MSDVPSQSAATELTRSPADELITTSAVAGFEVATLRQHKMWLGFQNWFAPFSGQSTVGISVPRYYPAFSPSQPQTGCPYATAWYYDGTHYPSIDFRKNCRRRFSTAATASTNPGGGDPNVGNVSMSTTLSTYGQVVTTYPGNPPHIPFMSVFEEFMFIPELDTNSGNVSTTQTWTGATGSDSSGDTGTITLTNERDAHTPISAMNTRLLARTNWPAWTGVSNSYQKVDEEFYEWGGGYIPNFGTASAIIPEGWLNSPETNLASFLGTGQGWNDVFTFAPDGHTLPAINIFPEGYVRTFALFDNIASQAINILWSGWYHPSFEEFGILPSGGYGSSIDSNYDLWARRTRVKFLNGSAYYIMKATLKAIQYEGVLPSGILINPGGGPPASSYYPNHILGNVSVNQSGMANSGDVVEIPFPTTTDFVQIDDTLSYGDIYFMLIGETPDQWATRNGITITGGSPRSSGADQSLSGGVG